MSVEFRTAAARGGCTSQQLRDPKDLLGRRRARSSTSGEFRFAAPPAGGMLILEYHEPSAETPIRVAIGYAVEHANQALVTSGS